MLVLMEVMRAIFYVEPWKEAMVHGVPTAKADSVLTKS